MEISVGSYSVEADLYEASSEGPVLLSLIGITSNKSRPRYTEFLPRLAKEHGITSLVFDYSGHGASTVDLDTICPAQHFLEVIAVFDWMRNAYPEQPMTVVGSSYGGFMAIQLTKYRQFENLVLRAPAMYLPEDFYTATGDRDDAATLAMRGDVQALSSHPLLGRAKRFEGTVSVLAHEFDEFIPAESTNAIAEAYSVTPVTAAGFTHSLEAHKDRQKEYLDTYLLPMILG